MIYNNAFYQELIDGLKIEGRQTDSEEANGEPEPEREPARIF